MNAVTISHSASTETLEIRVRGVVQGVGFRPTVWRLARECGLSGHVFNDGDCVLIQTSGDPVSLQEFCKRLTDEAPPLARIDSIETSALTEVPLPAAFMIVESRNGASRTNVVPDAAHCDACREETLSPFERRYRYPFTNCTHCGPRFSIIQGVPYDRAQTTMREFLVCEECAREYEDPADRRFHAQPVACHKCGPGAWLERLDGRAVSFDQFSMLDDVDAVTGLMQKGEIVAIKGIGGFHLACDATNAEAVEKLRSRKERDARPFALMARDIEMIERYCTVLDTEAALLRSPAAPIVLLNADGEAKLPEAIAPGLDTLGFMLPYTPLHLLTLRRMNRPVVMTSGNLSGEPQITDDCEVGNRLSSIADYALFHNREIANRIDDSVVRIMAGAPRILRRARGYVPSTIALPSGFESAPDLLAMGAELKSTFCLLKDGSAILSQHQGDLEDARTFDDYQKNLHLFTKLFDHHPSQIVIDAHPDYLSTKLGLEIAQEERLPVVTVQHHHAHIASCMAENGVAPDSPPILGIALDGLGYGDDGTIWGGEFLLADYRDYQRLGMFKPVAMIGGAQAIREPWRNIYAHLTAEMGWTRFAMDYDELELHRFLSSKPIATLDQMLKRGVNTPLASSCGRLFDAVAAAIGFAREQADFEGQGAMMLEAAISPEALEDGSEEAAYPFAVPNLDGDGLPYIEPVPMWQALLGDLILKTPVPVMAARFHKGLARAIVGMVRKLARMNSPDGPRFNQVALSGGCFQNKVLLELTIAGLHSHGFEVLTQSRIPANDGGIALGQAAIAAAHALHRKGN